MFHLLNEKWRQWEAFEGWHKTAYSVAIGLFGCLCVYASVYYWLALLPFIEGGFTLLFWLALYFILLAIFAPIAIGILGGVGVLIASFLHSCAWCYRKICP